MDLRTNIQAAEGCRLAAYLDSVGVWTIGYGHTPAKMGQVCSQAMADAWLDADIATAKALALKLPEATNLDPVRLDALTELIFNLGPNKWRLFAKTRAAIADGAWADAKANLLNSLWAKQVGVTRSTRIADMLLIGTVDKI